MYLNDQRTLFFSWLSSSGYLHGVLLEVPDELVVVLSHLLEPSLGLSQLLATGVRRGAGVAVEALVPGISGMAFLGQGWTGLGQAGST